MNNAPEPPTEDVVEYVPRHEAGLNRLVVALVGAVVLGVALVALAVGLYTTTASITSTFRTVVLGPLDFTVSNARPSEGLVLVAIIGIVVVAVVALLLEGIAALLSARPRRNVLSARRRGRRMVGPAGPVRVTVLVPAHDEETSLPATLDSLDAQTRRPDRASGSRAGPVRQVTQRAPRGLLRVRQRDGCLLVAGGAVARPPQARPLVRPRGGPGRADALTRARLAGVVAISRLPRQAPRHAHA